jgi:cyd operon protein YbgT
MWYFSWVLGLGFACTFAILNAMWLESRETADRDRLSRSADSSG